eukprot:1154520-Pelagomonas_calceolata.AAC.3
MLELEYMPRTPKVDPKTGAFSPPKPGVFEALMKQVAPNLRHFITRCTFKALELGCPGFWASCQISCSVNPNFTTMSPFHITCCTELGV